MRQEDDDTEAEYYDDFRQLDNGVGMIACLDKEFSDALADATTGAIEFAEDALPVMIDRAISQLPLPTIL